MPAHVIRQRPGRNRALLLLGAALLLSVTAFGCKKRHEALKLYREGQIAFRYHGELHEAEEALLAALEVDPALTHARVELADLYTNLGSKQVGLYSLDKAMDHLRRALEVAPNHVGAHYRLGKAALDKGDLSLAKEELAAARRLLDRPFGLGDAREWKDLQMYEGLLLLDEGDVEGAEGKFRRYVVLNRAYSYMYGFGFVLTAAARGDAQAEAKRRKALLDFKPPHDRAAFDAIVLAWEGRRDEGAEKLKRRLAELDEEIARQRPGSNRLLLLSARREAYKKFLARVYREKGAPEKARLLYPEGTDIPKASTYELTKVLFD